MGKVADIQVKGCVKSETICVAKKGTNVTFSAAFTPSEYLGYGIITFIYQYMWELSRL